MATLVRNLGLELPIYDKDMPIPSSTSAVTLAALQAANLGKLTFLRCMTLEYPDPDASLKEVLKLAKKTMRQAAETIQVTHVGYKWGLQEGHNNLYPSPLPQGYRLVGEVDVVPFATQLSTEAWDELRPNVSNFYNTVSGWAACDLQRSDQYVQAWQGSETPDPAAAKIIVDVEPRLKYYK